MNSSLGGYGHSDLHLRLMHVFGAWCFQCSGIPRLTYERHQRGKDTSCRAGAMGARGLSPHRLQHPVTAGHGQPSWHETGKPGTGSWRTQGILASSDVSRRGHRRSCIEKGDWVAYPVDLQGKRLFGRKVALVSVGANDIRQPLARRLGDAVYPDLAFALPTPRDVPVVVGMVGVGVMDYHGSNDDRRQAGHEHTHTDPFWGEVS